MQAVMSHVETLSLDKGTRSGVGEIQGFEQGRKMKSFVFSKATVIASWTLE